MSNMQAVELIVNNIQNLEEAKKLLEGELTEKLFDAVDNKIKKIVESFDEKWNGKFNFNDDGIQFSPESWRSTNGDNFKFQHYYAYYYLSCKSEAIDEDGTEWWFTTFLKNNVDQMAFYFTLGKDNFLKCNQRDLKKFTDEINITHPEIENLGFKYNSKSTSWFLIIDGIDPQLFIENYENDTLEDVLEPFEIALKKLQQAHLYFDAIVQAAKLKFNNEETVAV